MLCILLGTLTALVLTIVTPPLQTPDEHQHFARAYQISDGSLGTVQGNEAGAVLPVSILEMIDRFLGGRQLHSARVVPPSPLAGTLAYLATALDPGRRAFAAFSTTVLYPPVAYWPQAGAIALVRAASGGPLAMLYGARLAVVIVTSLLMLAATGLLRRGHLVVAFVFTLPMTVFLSASAAPDGFILGAAVVYMAIIARVRDDRRWTAAGFVTACVCAAFFTAVKPVYAPLLLLPAYAIVDSESKARAALAQAGLIAIVALVVAAWLGVTKGLFVPPLPASDIPGQVAFILANPMTFVGALAATMIFELPFLYRTMVGHLGWLNVPLPWVCYIIPVFGCLCIFLARSDMETPSTGGELAWTALLGLGSATLIHVAMYVYWTRVGLGFVEGVQGRYMLPLLPIALLALHRTARGRITRHPSLYRFGFATACALNLGLVLHTVVTTYKVL